MVATAIALPDREIVDNNGALLRNQYIEDAHKYALKVFVFPHNNNDERGPLAVTGSYSGRNFYYGQAGIDGVYAHVFTGVLQHNKGLVTKEKQKAALPDFFSTLKLSRPSVGEKSQEIQQ